MIFNYTHKLMLSLIDIREASSSKLMNKNAETHSQPLGKLKNLAENKKEKGLCWIPGFSPAP